MNQKKKGQIILLLFMLLLLTVVFLVLKRIPEEEMESTQETESYSVLDIDSALVREIGITTQEGTVDLYQDKDGWKCVGKEETALDEVQIEGFLGQLCTIRSDTRIEEVTDMAEYGLQDPVMQVTLQWEDNLYTIKAGDYNSIVDCYYISINDDATVYTADSILYNAMNKTLVDFEKVEEEKLEN